MTQTQMSQIHEMDIAIVKAVIAQTLAAGFSLTVFDGEQETVRRSKDPETVFAAMRTTDEDYLYTYRGLARLGWVRFIYGESGWDVICDHTVNLEPHLTEATALSDKYVEQLGVRGW